MRSLPSRRASPPPRDRRLYWWVEVVAVAGFYSVYSFIRNANQGGAAVARENALRVMRWQESLGVNVEESLQDWALHFRPLVIGLNYVYGSLHFVVTAGVVVWLYRKHPGEYPRWRNTLVITTTLALIGFVLWPLMPPRLLPEHFGFVDTMARYPTFWSFESGPLHQVSNPYAAMPSLHVAWSMFCAGALAPRLRNRWSRAVAWGYPALTVLAIVLTANHFFLDAAGGAVVFGVGFLLSRRTAERPPGAAAI